MFLFNNSSGSTTTTTTRQQTICDDRSVPRDMLRKDAHTAW